MDKEAEILAGFGEGMANAITLLIKSLEDAEALRKGAYAAKLRRHLRHVQKGKLPARWLFLHRLLFLVEGKQPPDPPTHPLRLRLIKGGKR